MAYQPYTLSPARVAALQELSGEIAVIRADIVKAKRAGVDVSQLEQALTRAETLRKGLLQQFGQ